MSDALDREALVGYWLQKAERGGWRPQPGSSRTETRPSP